MLSDLVKESVLQCTNPHCGHTFVAMTHIERTLSPSATPNPNVNLPISTHPSAGKPRHDAQMGTEAAR